MAEIRSTMDLVMERAAQMGKASTEEVEQESAHKKGMQLAAEYLNGKLETLLETVGQQEASHRESIRKGMLDSLIRNIFLARDDEGRERIGKALQGIVELGEGAGDLAAMCAELQNITGQYGQHREQYYNQLKEQMRMQIEQSLAQQGMSTEGLNFDPTTEPKFQEEWTRIQGELTGQYEQALTQYIQQMKQRLGI